MPRRGAAQDLQNTTINFVTRTNTYIAFYFAEQEFVQRDRGIEVQRKVLLLSDARSANHNAVRAPHDPAVMALSSRCRYYERGQYAAGGGTAGGRPSGRPEGEPPERGHFLHLFRRCAAELTPTTGLLVLAPRPTCSPAPPPFPDRCTSARCRPCERIDASANAPRCPQMRTWRMTCSSTYRRQA